MRVTLVIYSLSCGGAERVLASLADRRAAAGKAVTLVTLTGDDMPDFYEVDPAVRRVRLGIAGNSPGLIRGMLRNARRVRTLRRAIVASDPGAVVSFMSRTNVLVLLACMGLRVPVVVSERCDPSQIRIGRSWSVLRRLLYPFASTVVVQTESLRSFFGPAVRRRARVIPNPVGAGGDPVMPRQVGADRVVVSAGRLDPQKGFDLLIHAFAALAADHPGWTLKIWGEGKARRSLETLISRLGLDGRVRMPGTTKSLADEFRASDLYVLSSRYEGFPNVLCEAMAQGLPAIGFDCPSGPAEIIRDGEDGILVPREDVPALAAAMGRLMADEAERHRLAGRAAEVADRFSVGKVMGLWEEAIHTKP